MRLPNLVLVGAVVVALAPATSGAVQTYKVKKGDTLSGVASRYHLSVSDLKEANRLDSDALRPGQKLKVPSKASAARKSAARPGALKHAAAESKTPTKANDGVRRGAGREEARRHVVRKGDTLSVIARTYGVSVKEIRALNGLKKRSTLKPGMELRLAKGEAATDAEAARREHRETYSVQRGDNLWRVAKRFHMSASELKSLNGLRSDRLKPGQTLVVARHIAPVPDEASEEAVTECRLDDAKVDSDLLQAAAAEESEEGASIGATERVIRVAKKMLGIPYRFGGNSARGIDCSAYVQKVFRFLNVPLPRTAREQFEEGNAVSRDELATGDLVFFRTYARYPSHVGIYLGDNQFIHASSRGRQVTIDRLDQPFYNKRYIGAKRLVDEGAKDLPDAVEQKAKAEDLPASAG